MVDIFVIVMKYKNADRIKQFLYVYTVELPVLYGFVCAFLVFVMVECEVEV